MRKIQSILSRIFELCAGGLGPDKIARMLTQERVLTPPTPTAPEVSATPL